MPTEDTLAPAIGVELQADMIDEKQRPLAFPQEQQKVSEATPPGLGGDDSVEQDGSLPTTEELATLRRVSNKIPAKLLTIAFIELCERFSYYGSTVVFTNFIQHELPKGSSTGASLQQPGVLGMGQRASTGITTFNQFWQYSMPLIGAYVADQYWGRYKTISVSLGVDIFGHVILILAAIPPVITAGGTGASLALLILAILIIGLGTGGFKPNIGVIVVEQLGDQVLHVKTLKSGERVVVDPAVTLERIYMWFYFFINTGALIGQLTMVYAEQHVGFYLSFTLPTIMLCICPIILFWGRRRYTRREPGGSVLLLAFRTFFLAQRGRWSVNPFRTWKNMHDGTFWDSIKPSKFTDQTRPRWMTFDDAWVDELRRGFAACAVFCYYPLFWLCYNQINNNLVSQAAVMKRHGLPNDILSNLNPFSLLIFIPLNDFFIYPTLRKLGIRFTPIKKITAGFFTGCFAMVWAAVIQYYIYKKSVCGTNASGKMWSEEAGEMVNCPEVDINVWAQAGSYILIALSEVFASITSLEYAFSKAPKNMRSMVQAIALFMTAFAAALGQALVGLAADPLLVWNYAVVAILAFVAGCLFYLQFRSLDIQEDELNTLPEGTVLHVNDVEATKKIAYDDPQ